MDLGNSIQETIDRAASRYAINPIWIKSIIMQESRWKQYALRYEPEYPYLVKPEELAHKYGITEATETQSQKMSWGLGQIMGALAREQGHIGPMGELFEPSVNIDHVAMRLSYLKKHSETEDDVFASYNGGLGVLNSKKLHGIYSNQSYVDSVKKHLTLYQNG